MRAYSLIRAQPWYRREAFSAGLKAAGHEVLLRAPTHPDKNTLLVIWNRYGGVHEEALRVERAGGRVLVAENGYLGAGGTSPKFDVHPGGPQPHHYYAIAEGWHNGRGKWPDVIPGRFEALGVELKPWRTPLLPEEGCPQGGVVGATRHSTLDTRHILICPNRSFGVGDQVMHPDWAERTAARLRKQTQRPIKIRHHPGNDAPKRPLAEDLKNCWAVVIWSSGAGVQSLAAGIPTYVDAPFWIMKDAAALNVVDAPMMPERLPHFERMASAQWTLAEIESGEPFKQLLQ